MQDKNTPQNIAEEIAVTADKLVDCATLSARDKNTAIGMLYNCAAFIRGAEGMPGFRQAQFVPTTPGSLPNTPPTTPKPPTK
jgi:hypothetical protein